MWPAWRDVSNKTFCVLGHILEKHKSKGRLSRVLDHVGVDLLIRVLRVLSLTHSFIHSFIESYSRFHLCREKKFNWQDTTKGFRLSTGDRVYKRDLKQFHFVVNTDCNPPNRACRHIHRMAQGSCESSFIFEDLDGILTVDSLTVLKIISVDLFQRLGSKKNLQIKLSLFPNPNRYFGWRTKHPISWNRLIFVPALI